LNKRFLFIAFMLLALATSAVAQTVTAERVKLTTGPCMVRSGSGDPDGVVVGNICDAWLRSDTGTLYLKTTGTDHHGWTLLTSGGVTGTGTGGYLTGWTGTSTLGATGLTYTTSSITGGTWNAGAVTSSGNIAANGGSFTSTDNLSITPAASKYLILNSGSGQSIWLNPASGYVMPNFPYQINLGSLASKYLTLHAAELWVETLVAQNTIATIGGRVLVAPTTTLTADLPAAQAYLYTKHNNLTAGDRVYLEANGKVEFLAVLNITACPSGCEAGHTTDYILGVTRDLDGSGANDWYAGDAVLNTGTTGDGFIDLYSVSGVLSGYGPTIVGNVRTGTTYNNIAPRWAAGNLYNLYDYGADTYGFAAGNYATTWVSVDATNGFRINYGGAERVHIDASGNAAFTGTVTASAGAIGGWVIGTADLKDAAGTVGMSSAVTGGDDIRFWAGHATPASAPFRVTEAGSLTATSGAVGGFTLAANTLSSGADATYVGMSSAGTNAFWAGSGTFASAPFRVTAAGALTATTATITGTVNATAGYFGSGSTKVAINSDGLDVGSAGRILGGMTAYNTGTGFWLGYSGAYKFSIGHDDGQRLTWDGTDLTVVAATLGISSAGITITPDTTFQVSRMYGFESSLIGLGYVGGSSDTLALYTNHKIQFIKYDSGVVWGWELAEKALTVSGSDYEIGASGQPINRIYATTYYGGTSAGATYDPLTCGSGEAVTDVTVRGGIVTAMYCTAPSPSLAGRVLSLEQRISDLEAIIARRQQ